MPKVFVAPGHGRKPDGVFDPGAVGHAGGKQFVEHDFNTKVANALAAALRRCGVEVVLEDGGGNHDPNFIGSTKAANASGADYAVEVHHNATEDHRGTGSEVVVNDRASAANKQLAKAMAAAMASALGIRNRGVVARDREHFNREATMPACIPECAFVDSTTDQAVLDQPSYAATVAEAICEPLCGFLGVAFSPPSEAPGVSEEELSMANADEIMTFLKTMKQDLVVFGTPGLEKTVEDFASRQRETLDRLKKIEQRLATIEQRIGT
ncbi:MAG TPA: N-acetylmuramoyl-L-alanine amidase [Actinomycetes bacterium]|jgi:N-acetylmuramoyl-L-alanine amidase|nr:N-acetylmuramoyl-L-alanine amidase [Actinomycetes bacterium]